MRRGKFIAFEGLDGSGTTTQLNLLSDWLNDIGLRVERTMEPTTGPVGALIRQVIDHRVQVDSKVLALLFATDRIDHLTNSVNGIEQFVSDGSWVLSDRYVISSLAYQSADGVDSDWIAQINKYARPPDLTIFVDTEPAECMRRIVKRSLRSELFHREDVLRRTRNAYISELGRRELTGELAVIDGNGSVEAVFAQLCDAVERTFAASNPLASSRDDQSPRIGSARQPRNDPGQ